MTKYGILFLLFTLVSCSQKHKVYIIKQWHLSPNENTTNILRSKSLPQFDHQIDIYKKSLELIQNNDVKAIISEGCEGEIDQGFKLNFNGWTLAELEKRKDLSDYKDILAPVPMKLKAKFGDQLEVVCGDSNEYIKKNNLAFSDAKAFSGFFQRLFYYQNNDQKRFKKYLEAFKNVITLKEDDDPVLVAKEKALESLNKFGHFISVRNLFFLKKIIAEIKKNPIVIVGGLHIPGIIAELKKAKIDYEVITPVDYPENENKLLFDLKKALDQYEGKAKLIFNQVPYGFDPTFIQYKNLIPLKDIATKAEWKDLANLAKKYDFNEKLLRVDMDRDGIRDFTLSSSPKQIVLTAEDPDWDNDGIPNLLDSSIGKDVLFKIQLAQPPLPNRYKVTGVSEAKIFNFFKEKNIALLETKGAEHDLFILKVFQEVASKMKVDLKKIEILHATKPSFTYGKQVFFSYVKGTKSLEIYPEELYRYLAYKKENDFKGAKIKDFFNGYVTPLMIHSLAHELAHSLNFKIMEFAAKNGWQWKVEKIDSLYMRSYRVKDKILTENDYDYRYAGLTYAQWLESHKLYLKTVNQYLKKYPKNEDFLKQVKKLKWYTLTDSKKKEYQVSFLVNRKIPSLYSMSQPKEWFAELVACCIFQKFYPNSTKTQEAIRYELTIGLNPSVAPKQFCQLF